VNLIEGVMHNISYSVPKIRADSHLLTAANGIVPNEFSGNE
jgi:hypothetical protein